MKYDKSDFGIVKIILVLCSPWKITFEHSR